MNELKTETGAGDHASRLALRQLIRADQLTAARHTVMLSIPVAFVLSGISTFVAWHSGKFWVALIWLACATLVNLVRIPLCRLSPQRVAQLVPWMAPRGQVRDASDDFGVGYSSLGFLRQLHVSRVKIDRSFVTGLADQTENQALVSAVLQLAASFGFQVVAEGVESEEDLQVLQSMHCHAMQGHYFAEPMPAERARQHVLALTPA